MCYENAEISAFSGNNFLLLALRRRENPLKTPFPNWTFLIVTFNFHRCGPELILRKVLTYTPGRVNMSKAKIIGDDAGWSSPVARWAHNPKAESSNLSPATMRIPVSVMVTGILLIAEFSSTRQGTK